MEIKIRQAGPADVGKIIDLASELAVASVHPMRDVSEDFVRQFRRNDLRILHNLILLDKIGIFIAEDEKGGFMGHIISATDDLESSTGEPQGWLYDLAVKEEFQKLGIGRMLMERAVEFLRGKGMRYVGLLVTSTNAHAIRLYERLGFREERKRMIKKLV